MDGLTLIDFLPSALRLPELKRQYTDYHRPPTICNQALWNVTAFFQRQPAEKEATWAQNTTKEQEKTPKLPSSSSMRYVMDASVK